MDLSKRLKKSGVARKRAKAIWDHFEKEWEEENQPGPSSSASGSDSVLEVPVIDLPNSEHPDAPDMLEDEEDDVYDDTEFLYMEDDWNEAASDDEDEENYADSGPENNDFARRLRIWALSNKITHTALSDLLVLIRETTNISLPRCSKTLLKTPVRVEKDIATVGGGQMWYQGIQSSLQHYFRSAKEFPILMQVSNMPEIPIMVLGIIGLSKPNNVEGFIRPLVTEICKVILQGILINETVLDIRLRAFLADTPARAFIK
uniref:Uncharacterized protein n=2 Tax=Anopheles funestus TaxID=62324 RepID=A0A182S0C1_ANOFN